MSLSLAPDMRSFVSGACDASAKVGLCSTSCLMMCEDMAVGFNTLMMSCISELLLVHACRESDCNTKSSMDAVLV